MEEKLFCVRFLKDLEDSSGHVHKCVQGEVEIAAIDMPRAVEIARLRFAEQTQVPHWTLRADYEVVECLPANPEGI
jgi:hypothetical protein